MKVVFDAYWWISGPPSLRHVLRELVRAWNVAYPHDELTLVVREAHRAEAARELGGIGVIRSTTLWPQALAATLAVGAAARAVEADLVITHNFACRVRSGVSAVYLHDVLFASNPEWFTLPERLYFSFMRRWIRRATVVFTSTMTEAARIDEHTVARSVVAVGLGLSTELTEGRLPADPDRALVSGRFMLTVGRLNARKNLGATIRGALRSGRVRPDHPLVIVGSAEGRRDRLDAATSTAIADGSVRFVGFVSEERLRWYYRNTALFLFLSLGEGFGMPPVEAAHFGATVLASDLPVFHETLGALASYVDPTDEDAIAQAIADALDRTTARPAPAGLVAARHNWSLVVRAMRDEVSARAGVLL